MNLLSHGRWNAFVCNSLQVVFPHLSIPSSTYKISSELFVFVGQVIASDVFHKDPCYKDSDDSAYCGDNEGPLFAKIVLDRSEDFSPYCSTGLTNCCREAVLSEVEVSSAPLGNRCSEHYLRRYRGLLLHNSLMRVGQAYHLDQGCRKTASSHRKRRTVG